MAEMQATRLLRAAASYGLVRVDDQPLPAAARHTIRLRLPERRRMAELRQGLLRAAGPSTNRCCGLPTKQHWQCQIQQG